MPVIQIAARCRGKQKRIERKKKEKDRKEQN
jgi:hypothetical protein